MEDDAQNSIYNTLTTTPSKQAEPSVTIPHMQRARINELDDGRCLVTNVRGPLGILQCSLVDASTLKEEESNLVEIVWGMNRNELDLGSPRNVIQLESAWYFSFVQGDWAIVPMNSEIARTFERVDNAIRTRSLVSPSLHQMLERTEIKQYRLVFFEPFAGHVYHRATSEAQNAVETIAIPETRMSLPFESSCHPYFVIWDALPKFEKHSATLTEEQNYTYRLLKHVWASWNTYYETAQNQELDPFKAGGYQLGGGSGILKDYVKGDDDASQVDHAIGLSHSKRSRTARYRSHNKNPGDRSMASVMEDINKGPHFSTLQNLLLLMDRPITPPLDDSENDDSFDSEDSEELVDSGSKERFCYPDWSHVTTWLAGFPEECDPVEEQSAVWLVDEISRPPLPPRTSRVVWDNPPDTSKFSSNDWAAYELGTTLMRSVWPSEPSV